MKSRLIVLVFSLAAALLRAADDERPVVDASKIPVEKIANGALPTLHLVGDSTVRSGGEGGKVGWGERLKPFFDTNKINVVNQAIGGRSVRTFFTEGRWQHVADTLKAGDFVIIQFGHNDQGRIGDPANKHRADGPGIGDETAPDTMPDGSTEQVHTFGWYMTKYATDAKARGATVIICSPIPHKQHWKNGRDFEALAGWDKQVAEKTGARFLDLTMVITDAYKKIGAEKVETFFADKGTHTTDAGAQFNAARVIAGLKSLPGNPLKKFFSEPGETNGASLQKPNAEIPLPAARHAGDGSGAQTISNSTSAANQMPAGDRLPRRIFIRTPPVSVLNPARKSVAGIFSPAKSRFCFPSDCRKEITP